MTLDNKRRLFKLIEFYINEYRGDDVKLMYGESSRIKMHNITFSVTKKNILIEVIVVLGNLIKEEYIEKDFAEILVSDAMDYFFPDHIINACVTFNSWRLFDPQKNYLNFLIIFFIAIDKTSLLRRITPDATSLSAISFETSEMFFASIDCE